MTFLKKFSNFSFSINHMLFSISFSLMLALMIFPYFKYIFRSTLSFYASKETPFNVQGVKETSPAYKYTLILPLFITLLWFSPVSDFFQGFRACKDLFSFSFANLWIFLNISDMEVSILLFFSYN